MTTKSNMVHFSELQLSNVGREFKRALALVQDALQRGATHLAGGVVNAAQTEVIGCLTA